MKLLLGLTSFALGGMSGCAQPQLIQVGETRMLSAVAKPASCDLTLVEASMFDLSPLSTKWELLGMLTLQHTDRLDPLRPEARAELRPRACAMGGEALAKMIATTTLNSDGNEAGGVIFAVLRKKSALAAPQAF